MSAAAALAAVERVVGGGVKRASIWRSASVESATLCVYSASVSAVGPFTATSFSGPILGRT